MLCTDGETDGVFFDALVFQFFLCQLGVGGCSRVNDQALYVSHVGQQGEDVQAVDELVRFFLTAFDLEGEDGSSAVREVFLIEVVIWMIRQRWVVDLLDQRMIYQVIYDLLCILSMSVQTEGQGFYALQQQERVER